MNSQKGGRIQSATIVTVTNQSPRPNVVRNDTNLLAITDSKVVRFDQGNAGD